MSNPFKPPRKDKDDKPDQDTQVNPNTQADWREQPTQVDGNPPPFPQHPVNPAQAPQHPGGVQAPGGFGSPPPGGFNPPSHNYQIPQHNQIPHWQQATQVGGMPGQGPVRPGQTQIDQPMGQVEPLAILIVIEPTQNYGQPHIVRGGQARIGSDFKLEIPLHDPRQRISGYHAMIFLRKDENGDMRFVIQDNGSTNGVFVNDQRVNIYAPLNENDVIRIVEFKFVFKSIGLYDS